nr:MULTISPECIES: HEAT repeat domain-containing protein [Myxococcaceae]
MLLGAEQPPRSRAAAARTLAQAASAGEPVPESVRAQLPALLEDAQPEVRRAATVLASALLDGAAREEAVRARLADPEAEVRLEAAGRLADLGEPGLRGALAGMLEDPSFEVRFEAARGIASLGHGAGLEVLVEALDRAPLRFRALGALGELADARALPAVQKLFGRWLLPDFERTQAAGVLARLGEPKGAAHLLARTRKKWSPDRALAAELLGEVQAAGALERLREMVQDAGDVNRGAAARGLGRLGDAAALPWLTALLEDTSAPEDFRQDAAEALCLLGLPEARGAVERALPGFSAEVQAELRQTLQETA